MMSGLLGILVHPMDIPSRYVIWLIVPLSILVAVVYKTVRTRDLRRLPIEILSLCLYILAGEAALALVGYLFISIH